jgi:hypothetical protein
MCSPDNSFSGVGSDGADFLGGQATRSSRRSRNDQLLQWFDIAKFIENAIGTFGNAGRGPKYFHTDFGLLKATRVTERWNLQFRAAFFNIFNHPNFRRPNSNASSLQFGRSLRWWTTIRGSFSLG